MTHEHTSVEAKMINKPAVLTAVGRLLWSCNTDYAFITTIWEQWSGSPGSHQIHKPIGEIPKLVSDNVESNRELSGLSFRIISLIIKIMYSCCSYSTKSTQQTSSYAHSFQVCRLRRTMDLFNNRHAILDV